MRRFKTWLLNNGRNQTAVHMLITTGLGGGLSESILGGAWRNAAASIVSKNGSDSYYRSLCVHEAFHQFLNIGSRIFGGKSRPEHILGEVITGDNAGDLNQTPMVNGYLNEGLAAQGKCDSTATDADYTTELSSCTLEKTLESYRNQGKVLDAV